MGSQDKNQDKDTREQLVAAGMRLFARKGFNGASVKDIAEEAGVNVALVSYYFGGKEGLYKACFESFVETRMEFLNKKILRPSSREEFRFRLQLFLETMIENDLAEPDCSCIIRREIESEDPIVKEIFKKTLLKLFSTLIGFMEHAQKAGYLRSDFEAKDMCGLLMGALQHRLRIDAMAKEIFGETLQDEKVRARFVKTIIEMFLHGFEMPEVKK